MDYKSVLINLVENKISADDWLDWWEENEMFLKKNISPTWFLKIKPKLSQGSAGATLISQNNAKLFLKSNHIDFNNESNENFKTKWLETIEDIGRNRLKESNEDRKKILFSIKLLYPNLYNALSENLIDVDVLEKELTADNDCFKFFASIKLVSSITDFFTYISSLRVEGVFLDFRLIAENDDYIKIGEMWVNNDGDELLVKPNREEVYLKNIRTKKVGKIGENFHDFLENKLSQFILEN